MNDDVEALIEFPDEGRDLEGLMAFLRERFPTGRFSLISSLEESPDGESKNGQSKEHAAP